MISRPFADLMTELLRGYGLTLPAGPVQEVYTLHFDVQPPAYIVARADDAHVNVLLEAGRLATPPSVEQLLGLLELKTDQALGQPATVTVHRPSSTVIVRTCQPRAMLNADGLRTMLDNARSHAGLVSQRLVRARSAPSSQQTAAVRLQMMRLAR